MVLVGDVGEGGGDDGDADDDGLGEEVNITVCDDEIDVVTLVDESEPGVEPSDDVQPASRPNARQRDSAPKGLIHLHLKACPHSSDARTALGSRLTPTAVKSTFAQLSSG